MNVISYNVNLGKRKGDTRGDGHGDKVFLALTLCQCDEKADVRDGEWS